MSYTMRKFCFASLLYPLLSLSPDGVLGQPLSASGKFPVADGLGGLPLIRLLAPRETITLAADSITSSDFTSTSMSNIPTSKTSISSSISTSNTPSQAVSTSTNDFAGFQPVSTSAEIPIQPSIPQRAGMSTGARAGIAIGVILGVAISTAIATWLFLKERRSLAKRNSVDSEMVDLKGGSTRHERNASHDTQEMDVKKDDYAIQGPYNKLS